MAISMRAGQVRALVEALDAGDVPDEHVLHLVTTEDDDVIARLNPQDQIYLEADERRWEVQGR